MSEREQRGGKSGRQPAEGVRIIRPEEAQAALEAGEAAGRRPGDQLRFGDVPPAPEGPRPAHRFPLPDSVDPARAVDLPPLAVPPRAGESGAPPPPPPIEEAPSWRPEPVEPPAIPIRDKEPPIEMQRTWTPDFPARSTAGPAAAPRASSGWEDRAGGEPAGLDEAGPHDRTTEMGVPEEGITVSGGMTDMPHWTDPPTGEVPRLRFDEEPEEDDDLEAWKALGDRGVRWREEDDWDDAGQLSELVGDVEPMGALDSNRPERSDLYSFDEDFERVTSRTGSQPVLDLDDEPEGELEAPTPPRPRHSSRPTRSTRAARSSRAPRRPAADPGPEWGDPEAAPAATGTAPRPANPRLTRRPPGGGAGRSGDLGGRVLVGAGLVVLLGICYAIGPAALLALTTVILAASAAEAYRMIQGAGFRPATLLGLLATVGCVLGAYWKGPEAIPVVSVLLFVGAMLWYVMGIVEARPLANVAVTVMVYVWVAVLGSFAGVMLAEPHGKGRFLGAVVVAVVADICAFVVGRWIGSRPMAAHISPNKTVEGFVGGLIGALIAGVIIGKELAPWGGMKHGLLLGFIIGIIAPAGDLFESILKRDLGLKDSGTVLGGHGGLLDRFDGVLLALPAAYFVLSFFKL